MADKPFEFLEHTADVAIRIHAKNEGDLFEIGARALYEILGPPILVDPGAADAFPLELQAGTLEDLFHDWLAEILFQAQVRRCFFERFRFESLTSTHLKCVAERKKIDPEKTQVKIEIKAVTYHHLRIEQTSEGLIATVIFDI